MTTYTDANIIRNGLLALKVLALSNADEYLDDLADKGLEALDRITNTDAPVEKQEEPSNP